MALTASPQDQELLLDLQALDTKLAQLGHRAKSIPELAQLVDLAHQSGAKRKLQSERRGSMEDIELELGRVEGDVTVVQARITRDSERLQASSSVKDVAALEHELTALRKRLGDLEEIELAVMERLENIQIALAETTTELAVLADRASEVEAARDAQLVSINAERVTAHAARESVVVRIPSDLLALYEKQRSRYGTGASLLRGGVSLASGVKLLENEMQAIRVAAPDEIIMCASSEAILVRTDESGL
jgi:predicted  nucleic acid-binding Zn-ribbon protein